MSTTPPILLPRRLVIISRLADPDYKSMYTLHFVDRLCPDCADRMRDLEPHNKMEIDRGEDWTYKRYDYIVWVCPECYKI